MQAGDSVANRASRFIAAARALHFAQGITTAQVSDECAAYAKDLIGCRLFPNEIQELKGPIVDAYWQAVELSERPRMRQVRGHLLFVTGETASSASGTKEKRESPQAKAHKRRAVEENRALAVLGLPLGSSKREVREAFKRLALIYHPDRNPRGAEKFKEIANAYQLLCK